MQSWIHAPGFMHSDAPVLGQLRLRSIRVIDACDQLPWGGQSCPGQNACEAAVPSDESHNSQHQMVSQYNWEWREEKHRRAYRDWCVFISIFAVLHCFLIILHHYEIQFKSVIHSLLLYQPALLVSRLLLWYWGLSCWRSSTVTACIFTAVTWILEFWRKMVMLRKRL